MYKSRAWQIWFKNDPDAQKFFRSSKTMCCHGVNIPELTREAFIAGVAMRPYIKVVKISSHNKQNKSLLSGGRVDPGGGVDPRRGDGGHNFHDRRARYYGGGCNREGN